jgi:hypothetical protein
MPDDPLPASPNLDALTRNRPACKRAVIRLLWPKIRVSLDLGHTAREVYEKLRMDGIEISYPSLCRYVADLRTAERNGQSPATAAQQSRTNKERSDAGSKAPDPLANVRRLTEEKRPGFHYSGTMSEKELFGE